MVRVERVRGAPDACGYQIRLGRSPIDAIRSGTSIAAALPGTADRVDDIERGRFADLPALGTHPLVDIEVRRAPPTVVEGDSPVAPLDGAGLATGRSAGHRAPTVPPSTTKAEPTAMRHWPRAWRRPRNMADMVFSSITR